MKRKLCILLALCFTALFAGCKEQENENRTSYYFSLSMFSTQYTEEEHVQRITQRTEEIFAEEIANGELVDYNVEIVYSIYRDLPAFFLVELEYAEEWADRQDDRNYPDVYYTTKYKHLLGLIAWDEYYATLSEYCNTNDTKRAFMDGRSAYASSEYPDSKKYCGGKYKGVAVEGGIFLLAHTECLRGEETYEFHVHDANCDDFYLGTVITEDIYNRFAGIECLYRGFIEDTSDKRIYK